MRFKFYYFNCRTNVKEQNFSIDKLHQGRFYVNKINTLFFIKKSDKRNVISENSGVKKILLRFTIRM